MGWTKRRDAIQSMKQNLKRVRAELRDFGTGRGYEFDNSRVRELLDEHESLCSALAYGQRDGVIRSELGINVAYKEFDYSPVLTRFVDGYNRIKTLTWKRKR